MVKEGIGIHREDVNIINEAARFSRLFKAEWNKRVNAPARSRKQKLEHNKIIEIPTTSDLVMLQKHLCTKLQEQELQELGSN